jgi:formylglycine-generating enzyme required for sulfatase activity
MPIELRKIYAGNWTYIAIGTIAGAILTTGLRYRRHVTQPADAAQAAGAYCDNGLAGPRSHRGRANRSVAATSTLPPATAWVPAINTGRPAEPAPPGMVWIPGGQFWMGSDDGHMPDTKPWHRVYVDGYWMDRTEVTNQQFARFVKATGYVTVAERKPRAEDYPTAPPENLIAGSVIFTPPTHPVNLNNRFQMVELYCRSQLAPPGRSRVGYPEPNEPPRGAHRL